MEFRLYLLFYLNSKLTAQRCAVGLTDLVTYLHIVYTLLSAFDQLGEIFPCNTILHGMHMKYYTVTVNHYFLNLILQLLLNMFVMAAQ